MFMGSYKTWTGLWTQRITIPNYKLTCDFRVLILHPHRLHQYCDSTAVISACAEDYWLAVNISTYTLQAVSIRLTNAKVTMLLDLAGCIRYHVHSTVLSDSIIDVG